MHLGKCFDTVSDDAEIGSSLFLIYNVGYQLDTIVSTLFPYYLVVFGLFNRFLVFIGDFVSVSESKGEAWVGDWDRGYALERFYRMVFSGVSISKDLCRGPYAIILNRLYIIIRTIVFSNAQPLVVGGGY